ncbi:hypothetical protein PanWU01x14_049410 [Parasponia andersonii]|uniref:Uncharacterized protein n=1 Tax=Parasponia andersonii TaxID=3476 RepID=A0A2P5DMN3_PARAD|nr:hypothetical protein PanWU01x14_049410 [Parasponia andersonii]
MSHLLEEKGDKDYNFQATDSLEERVSVFFDEYYCHSDESDDRRCLEYDQSDGDDDSRHPEERTLYWESQYSLLQEVLERYSLTGSKLRREIRRTIDMAKETDYCHCPKPKTDHGCNYCLRRTVVKILRENGINASSCSSKWRNTKKFLQGSHEYIEVMGSTSSRKKAQKIPYLVELEFRDQFEIAKPCHEYRKLLSLLPEYYIGKADCLNAVVRIVCGAAKRSMKEKKIHMGPWRETSFMLMKWSKVPLTEPHDKFPPISPPPPSQSQFLVAPPAVVVT